MKCHAFEGAAAGAAGGLAALALGVPVLAPIALIAGLVAGICKDNNEVQRERRRVIQDREALESNEYDYGEHDYHRHISRTVDSDIDSMLREIHNQQRQPEYQWRIMNQGLGVAPFRVENEDDDTPRFIDDDHAERRPGMGVNNTDEPSLRNEEYFRRHNGL